MAALSSSVDCCSPLATMPGIDENTIVGTTGALVLAVTSFVLLPKFSDREGRLLDEAAPETYFAPFPLPGFDGGRRRTIIDVARGIIALSSVYSISLIPLVGLLPSFVDSSYIDKSKS